MNREKDRFSAYRPWPIRCILLLPLIVVTCDRQSANISGQLTGQPLSAESGVTIRVFLFEAPQAYLTGTGGSYSLWDLATNKLLIRRRDTQKCLITRRTGHWHVQDGSGKDLLTIAAQDDLTRQIEIRPDKATLLSAGRDTLRPYRGKFHLIARSAELFAVVNVVDIEQYLAGVVGAEMPAYWYMAALRAQSIASRTYALYQMHVTNINKQWDIGSDQGSQVYRGLAQESRRVSQAVRQTQGIVLTYGRSGQEKIFPTYYSSTCGGHTQNAHKVFGESLAIA